MKMHLNWEWCSTSQYGTGLSVRWKAAGLAVLLTWTGLSPVVAEQDPPGCTGSGLGIALFVDKPQAHVGDTLVYSALVYNTPFPGCKASGIKAWVVTPDGVTNNITLLRRDVLNPGESDAYDNVATYVVRAQDLIGGLVRASAGDFAKIHQNETLSDGEAGQTVNTLIMNPCIAIAAVCTNGVGQDGTIAFSGTVRNCGDIDLGGVTVSNLVDGVGTLVLGPVTLAEGQSLPFSGSYIPGNPCNASGATFVAAGTDALLQPRTVTATTTTTCAIALTPGIAMGQACPPGPVAGGSLLSYSGTVTNTGNVTLTNVVVMSDQPAPGTVIFSQASLAPGAVANFTAQFTAPLNVCSVTTSLRVTATSLCGSPVAANSSSTCPLLATPAIVVTQDCPPTPTAPGAVLTYSGTVKNSGDITLREIIVTRAGPDTVVFRLDSLAPGATAPFTSSFTTPADACSVSSTLTASAKDVCLSQAVSNTVTTVCPLTPTPAIAITQSCPPAAATLGGALTYSGTVLNTGNITLLNVAVVSERPNNTVVFQIASLAPGTATNFTASYPIPANLNDCAVTNTLTVTGFDKCSSAPVSAAVTSACPLQSAPKILLTVNCPLTPVAPGAVLTYTGTLSNPGDITLLNVSVVANQPVGATVLSVSSLAPGTATNFTGSYTVPLDACSSTVTVSASGVDACAGSVVRDSVTQTCPLSPAPAVTVSLECPPTATAPGKALVFTGKITNTGNITLTNVTVEVDRPTPSTPVFGPVVLAPGASRPFTGSYLVPTNLNSCFITTTAIVRGNSQCDSSPVAATATSACPILTSPAILLTTACPPTATPQGGLLVYSGTVKNTGNIALTNVVVVSNRPSNNVPVISIATLLPDQATNFTGSFVVPNDCCEVVTTLAVTGTDICGASNVVDTATLICPVLYTPGIRISRVCPTEAVKPGEPLLFAGEVINTGDVTLTGVLAVSSILGSDHLLLGPIDLAPGESAPYSASYVVPPDYCGADTVTVAGVSICGTAVTDALTTTCLVDTQPGIAVVNAIAGPVSCGENVGRGSVANTGNVSLTDVWVYANQPANNTPVFGPFVLPPGAVTNLLYKFTNPQGCNCCETAVTLTAVGKGLCDGRQVSDTSTRVVPVLTSPQLTVSLDCADPNLGVGLISGIVANAGDIALSNVVVTATLPTVGTVLVGPINLAPGESQLFVADAGSTDPAILRTFGVVATGNTICGGGVVRAAATCTKAAPGPLTITVGANQSVTLSWPALAGMRYRVEFKKSLADTWQALGADVDAGSSVLPMTKVDATGAETTRFYRLMILE